MVATARRANCETIPTAARVTLVLCLAILLLIQLVPPASTVRAEVRPLARVTIHGEGSEDRDPGFKLRFTLELIGGSLRILSGEGTFRLFGSPFDPEDSWGLLTGFVGAVEAGTLRAAGFAVSRFPKSDWSGVSGPDVVLDGTFNPPSEDSEFFAGYELTFGPIPPDSQFAGETFIFTGTAHVALFVACSTPPC